MKHLTVDEIIRFVSMTELNDETLALSAIVNSHIRRCKECLDLVRAFQLLHDEFMHMQNGGEFVKAAKEFWAQQQVQAQNKDLEM